MIFIYLIWIFLESKVSKDEIHKGNQIHDFGTLEFYAVSQALTFLSALGLTSYWQAPHWVHLFGFAVFLFGIGIRGWAIKTLGRYYSHMVREVDDHKIVDSGPYKYIRHPAYAGMIVAHVGIILYFFNLITLLIFVFAFIPAIILRIFIEEKTLFKIEGYADFAETRKRLIPAIW